MLEVHMHAGFARHLDIAFDDFQFGIFGNAGYAQFS